ncbi:MAG: Fic family protein [Phycisphaerae bacterium]|nr:Fic family protein [Phycisphaerae bacterium]
MRQTTKKILISTNLVFLHFTLPNILIMDKLVFQDSAGKNDKRILMKIPQAPPDMEVLFKKAFLSKRTDSVFEITRRMKNDGQYRHWDKIRHLKPPKPLTHEEWWLAMKLARMGLLSPLPELDTKGIPFQYGLPAPIPERLHYIDQNAGGTISMLEDSALTPDTRDRYLVRSLVEEAITSSQLEGAATTRAVAKEMIRSKRPPRDNSERMILNNYHAMQQIRSLKDKELTPDIVFYLHTVLTEGTLEKSDAVGRFRTSDEDVRAITPYNEILNTPPHAKELPERMKAMCDFANGKPRVEFVHPVIRAIVLHFWLAYDHPFYDGNGRCARALFYWSVLREGYWLFEFTSISQMIRMSPAQYGRAFLYSETDENDLTYFLLYHLEVLMKSMEELHEYIQRKTAEIHATESLMKASLGMNYRQKALLSHALRHENAAYTFRSHQGSHDIVYQTARTDLLDLAERGLLQKTKTGGVFVFKPVPNLADTLQVLEE